MNILCSLDFSSVHNEDFDQLKNWLVLDWEDFSPVRFNRATKHNHFSEEIEKKLRLHWNY